MTNTLQWCKTKIDLPAIKQVMLAVSNNLFSDTMQLAQELWQKLLQGIKILGDILHKAVKYIGQNPIILFALFSDGFHHHH